MTGVNPPTRQEVDGLRRTLGLMLGRLVPDDVSSLEAPELWQAFDGIERLAASAKTLLARRVDHSGVWQRSGYRSPADYLAAKAGTSVGSARQALDTSKKLASLPHTEAAARRGQLSRAQVEAIADAAAVNPDAERRLVGAAQRTGLGELRDHCQRAKAAADRHAEARYQRIHTERRLRQWTDAQGAWNALVRGTPDAGARFNAALQPIIEERFAAARREGRHEHHEAYAFDALVELACRAHTRPPEHDSDSAEDTGDGDAVDSDSHDTDHRNTVDSSDTHDRGDGDTVDSDSHDTDHRNTVDSSDTHDTGDGDLVDKDLGHVAEAPSVGANRTRAGPALGREDVEAAPNRRQRRRALKTRSRRSPPTYQALLRLDYPALVRGYIAGDELCEITGLGPIPVPVARELLGDAVLKLVITKGVDVAHVTHLGRGPSAAQHIALLWSSPTCIVQGCNDIRVQRDHRVPWSDCRQTSLDNLDPECRWHHYLKTHCGWALVAGTGKRPMVPPDDPRHPNYTPAGQQVPPGDTPAGDTPAGTATTTTTTSAPEPARTPGPRSGDAACDARHGDGYPPASPSLFDDAA